MLMSREKIKEIVEKVGQPEASMLINGFFNNYRKKIHSCDVQDAYDSLYFQKLREHPVKEIVDAKYTINIYNYFAYNYVKNEARGKRVLDIGCGNGDVILALAHHGFECVGVDFYQPSIDHAQKVAEENNLSAAFIYADVKDLAETLKFDYVIMNDISEHISDTEFAGVLEKVRKILAPEGKLLLHTPNGLALCHEIDWSWVQVAFKTYLKWFKGYKGFERTLDQLFYDQVHINIKSYAQLKHFLKQHGFDARVIYDEAPTTRKLRFITFLLDAILSTNMLVIATKNEKAGTKCL